MEKERDFFFKKWYRNHYLSAGSLPSGSAKSYTEFEEYLIYSTSESTYEIAVITSQAIGPTNSGVSNIRPMGWMWPTEVLHPDHVINWLFQDCFFKDRR